MSTEPSLPHHRLPADSVAELSRGEGSPHTLDLLLDAERSRRLLLLRLLDETAGLGHAWDLLTEAQRRSPPVVDEVLMYPQTGMWAADALRRLRGSVPQDETPLWVALGQASAVAAVAGLRAGVDFSIEVPVRHGRAVLPSLGCAVLPAAEPWTTAVVRSEGGRAVVEAAGGTVAVPPAPGTAGPGWHPVRRLTVGPSEHRLDVALDDVDPYRTYPLPTDPVPLADKDVVRWRQVLEHAWAVLLREQPAAAEAMRRGVLSLSPTPARERFRPRSVTTGDAFGGIQVSEPDDSVQLAVTLVHEFQHTKLGGLLHLKPLLKPADGAQELWYAPWRDDPRPLDGLLQGIYAFAGVTRFWNAHRCAPGARAATAHFEFALWRMHVAKAMNQVRRHPRLTRTGAALLETLREHVARWLTEPVPSRPLALARMCATDHAARWRAHHLQPPEEAVDEAVRAWRAGASRPPAALAAGPAVVTDPSARWLDCLATLVRHHLDEADDGRRSCEHPEKTAARVTGALTGDALLAVGDVAAARHAYAAQLRAEPGRAAAWAGLGLAMEPEGADSAAARLLCEHPERARAVHLALARATGRPPDPVRLAAWLAS